MDKNKLKKMQKLAASPEIQKKMAEANSGEEWTPVRIIDFWRAQGIDLTEDDLKMPKHNMSDDELEAVSGGGGCGCVLGGGGSGDFLDCNCVGGGAGSIDWKDKDGTVKKGSKGFYNKYGGCICPVAGVGATNWGNVPPHPLEPNEK